MNTNHFPSKSVTKSFLRQKSWPRMRPKTTRA